MRWARPLSATLVAGMLLVACADADPPDDDPAPTSAPDSNGDDSDSGDGESDDAAPSALERLTELRGELDEVELALTELGMHLGAPLPGAVPVEPDDSVGVSATDAVTAVAAVWDELDAEQQEAVRSLLAPYRDAAAAATPVDLTLAAPPPDRTPRADASDEATLVAAGLHVTASGDTRPPSEGTAEEIAAAWSQVFDELGGARPVGGLVAVAELPLSGGDAARTEAGVLTTTDIVLEIIFGTTAEGSDCLLLLGPEVESLPDDVRRTLFFHEGFHCWSIVNAPNWGGHVATPTWYQEGVAAWLGEGSQGGTSYSTGWWSAWLGSEAVPLYATSYQAIGFWSWLAGNDPGLLGRIGDLHAVAVTGDDAALLEAALAPLDGEAVTGAAASRARASGLGPAWQLAGPGLGGQRVTPLPFRLPLGTARPVDAAAGELVLRAFERPAATGDTVLGVRVTGNGQWRAAWSDGPQVVVAGAPGEARWCAADPCRCPDGSTPEGWEPLGPGPELLTVAVTGRPAGATSVEVEAVDVCEEPEPEPEPEPGGDAALVGTWVALPGAVDGWLQLVLGDDIPGSDLTPTSGRVVLSFAADGTAQVFYDTLRIDVSASGTTLPLTVTGGGSVGWSTRGTDVTFTSTEKVQLQFEFLGEDLAIGGGDLPSGTVEGSWGVDGGRLTLQTRPQSWLPNTWRRGP